MKLVCHMYNLPGQARGWGFINIYANYNFCNMDTISASGSRQDLSFEYINFNVIKLRGQL